MSSRRSQIIALSVGVIVAAVGLYVLAAHFELRAHMERIVTQIREAGPLPFFTAMALLPAVGFPLSLFTLAAGPVFAPTMGVTSVIAAGIFAVAIDVALSYWIAARAFRPVLERLVRWRGYELPVVQPHTVWPVIIIVRIVPGTPFCVQGILLGLARVPFGPYMLISTLVPATYIVAIVVLGDALMRRDPWAIAAAGLLFFLVGAVIHLLRKRLRARPAVAPAKSV